MAADLPCHALQAGHAAVRWSVRIAAGESVGTRVAWVSGMYRQAEFVPFDERAPFYFERRVQEYAEPKGSKCCCRECAASWALSHGEPEEIEKELRG